MTRVEKISTRSNLPTYLPNQSSNLQAPVKPLQSGVACLAFRQKWAACDSRDGTRSQRGFVTHHFGQGTKQTTPAGIGPMGVYGLEDWVGRLLGRLGRVEKNLGRDIHL